MHEMCSALLHYTFILLALYHQKIFKAVEKSLYPDPEKNKIIPGVADMKILIHLIFTYSETFEW